MSNNKPSHNAARGLSDGFKVGYWLLITDRNGRSHPILARLIIPQTADSFIQKTNFKATLKNTLL
jgi:hypothetical protein